MRPVTVDVCYLLWAKHWGISVFRSLLERARVSFYIEYKDEEWALKWKAALFLLLHSCQMVYVFLPFNTAQPFHSVFQLDYILIISSWSYLQLLVTAHSYLMCLVDGTVFHEVFETSQTDHSLLNVKTCKIYGTVWSCYWQLISCSRMSVHIYNLW